MKTQPPNRPHAIARCDVVNKDALKKFRRKRAEWLKSFDRDKFHSVTGQLRQMLMNHAVFRVIYRRSLELAEVGGKPVSGSNSYVSRYFEHSWLPLQALHIRKITESGYEHGKPRRPDRQVISLKRIAEDVRDNWELFTRENFVCYDGAPFDLDKAYSKFWKQNPADGRARFVPIRGELGYSTSRLRHANFDKIAGRKYRKHKRDDALPREVIDDVLRRLDRARRYVEEVANKIVAHPADPYSRKSARGRLRNPILFSRVEKIHRNLCEIANFLSAFFVSGAQHSTFFPHPQFDPLEHLREPWVHEENLKSLRAYWKEYQNGVELSLGHQLTRAGSTHREHTRVASQSTPQITSSPAIPP